MKNSILKYEVTPISLEYFKQRSFEIIFDVFNCMNSVEDDLVKDYISSIGNEEFYESLKYHNDVVYSSLLTKNYDLMIDFFIWKYSVYHSRNIDLDCFFKEYDFWKESILNHLYPSHASEINIMYDYLISNHQHLKIKALKTKNIMLNKEYQSLFDELLSSLLSGQKEQFHNLVKKDLKEFNNNIFSFVEKLINPLMYEIGQMWQLNKISVAKEHLSSSLIDEVINDFIQNSFVDNSKKLVAITSTVGNELHNLGIKIVGKFIETYGYSVKNITSKISTKELINSIYDLKPTLVVLSVTLPSNVATLQEIVKELKSDYNLFNGLVVVGGQGLFNSKQNILIKEADLCCETLDDLDNFLKKINTN